ncbi:MAG: dockerin type I repeat-containing protein [Prevotella sp.]|nr:dockerin type I repeat-containing protein [Prevotella sp.]
MDFQQDKNAPYFDVYQLFVDINAEGKPEVFYRGYTNMEAAANILCGEAQTAATMDGDTRSAVVPGSPTAAAMVVLTNGERADTTWVVPPTEYELEASATLTIATGLPEDYTIASVYSKNGIEATVDGVNISYTAPEDLDTDTLYISYYEGSRLRGFTEFYIVNPNAISTLLGDANNDRRVNIADITAVINKISGRQPTRFIQQNVDFNNDGKITEIDITPLINIILGKQQ